MFMAPEQLIEFTGYKQAAAQARALTAMGYTFDKDRNGRPKLLLAAVKAKQLRTETSVTHSAFSPDVGALLLSIKGKKNGAPTHK